MNKANPSKTKSMADGIINAIVKIIKNTALFGVAIPFLIYIFIRFLEICFGFAWEQQLVFQYLAYIYVLGYTVFLLYKSIKNQLYSTLYYSIGWILGVLLLYRLGVFQWSVFKDFLFVPVVFVFLKIIYLLFIPKTSEKRAAKTPRM